MQDLSNLAIGSLGLRAGSMAAADTVSVKPDYGAPGTDSESVTAADVQHVPDDVPAGGSSARDEVLDRGTAYAPPPPAWKTAGSMSRIGR